MAVLDEAIRMGQSHQKDLQSNQIDIFAALGQAEGAPGKTTNLYPQIKEWPANQVLSFEKESLGFYITGHPLDKYDRAIHRLTSGSVARLRENQATGEVKVAGVVTALKLRNTKKGERYASFNLEDKTGFIGVIVWPDVYRKSVESLSKDDPILIQGRLDIGEERVQLIAKEVTPMADVIARKRASADTGMNASRNLADKEELHFYVQSPEVTTQELSRLHKILLDSRGGCTVFLHFSNSNRNETVIELPHHLKINPTPELLETVNRSFGSRITTRA